MAPEVYNLRQHSMKVYVPRCAKIIRKTFFSVLVCFRNLLPQHVIEARLDKFWSDMGVWKLQLLSPSSILPCYTAYGHMHRFRWFIRFSN